MNGRGYPLPEVQITLHNMEASILQMLPEYTMDLHKGIKEALAGAVEAFDFVACVQQEVDRILARLVREMVRTQMQDQAVLDSVRREVSEGLARGVPAEDGS